jgi:hypothetical protein
MLRKGQLKDRLHGRFNSLTATRLSKSRGRLQGYAVAVSSVDLSGWFVQPSSTMATPK